MLATSTVKMIATTLQRPAISEESLKPKITFKLPIRSISLCVETIIEPEKIEVSGNRDLTFIAWTLANSQLLSARDLAILNALVGVAN